MTSRFPTWAISIRRGRRSLATATLVAKPIGIEIESNFPLLAYERETLAGVLCALAYQVTDSKFRKEALEPALKAYGWEPPFPETISAVVIGDDPEDEDTSDIPF